MEALGMSESGVDLDFDQLLEADEQINCETYYEIVSRPVDFESTKPEVKNVPPTKSRTQLRQQLMRQHDFVQQQKKKDDELNTSTAVSKTTIPGVATIQTSTPAVQIAASLPSELPPQVLKVRPLLEHPTRHHVKQMQKRQVQEFLSTQMGKPHGGQQASSAPTTTQSLPSVIAAANNSLNMASPVYMSGSSLPVDPDSPLSAGLSSTATSVDDIDLIGDIISCESFDASMDSELQALEPSLPQIAHTMPHNTAYLDHGYDIATSPKNDKSSSSCPPEILGTPQSTSTKHHGGRQRQGQPPPYLTAEETRQWYRERQKKDSHNMIEKRRRLTINDKIKELGEILPKSAHDGGLYSDMRQNKGSILKASVDYIYKLKRDQEKLRQMEDKQRQMEVMNRKMLLKIQEMEMLMQAHGITSPSPSGTSSSNLMSQVLHQSSSGAGIGDVLKQEPSGHASPHLPRQPHPPQPHELMDDASSPVQGDPMMTSVLQTNSRTVNVEDISDMLS